MNGLLASDRVFKGFTQTDRMQWDKKKFRFMYILLKKLKELMQNFDKVVGHFGEFPNQFEADKIH